MNLLIDADIIAFKATSALETRVDWEDDGDINQIPGDLEAVYRKADEEIAKICRKLKSDNVIICLSCDAIDNFRKDVLPSYKGNRAGNLRPVHLERVKQYLETEYRSFRKPRLEGDDVMGILATHPRILKGDSVIVSEDKDMRTIPGYLLNPAKDQKVREVSHSEAEDFFLFQTLTGDPVDGYKGAPGVGPVKAEEILRNVKGATMYYKWAAVVSIYAGAMKRSEGREVTHEEAEEAALQQARCARILRHTDYNFKTKEPILWTPNSK